MSDPSLFVSPLVCQAARNLHTVEWLSENNTWSYDSSYRWNFWRTWRTMAMTPDEATAWLPARAFAVSRENNPDVLAELARQPLPEPLPPEAIPWRDRLIQVWEQYPVAIAWEQYPAAIVWVETNRLAALVRLDRRVERLPEWLTEARRARDLWWYDRDLRLAALAGWRPRPGDGLPHGDKAEAAQAWVRFWEERYRTSRSELNVLVAAAVLLHLAEAGWLPSGPSPEGLREEFRQRMQQVQQWPVSYHERSVLGMLLSSVPADASAPERRQQDIRKWLELIHKNVRWEERELVWEMLAAWQREGILERGGISLVPDLAQTLEWEDYGDVLIAMAGYVPGLAEVRAHPEAMRAVVARWEALSRNNSWQIRQAAWVARWNLMRAGVLTTEEQARFGADYVEAVKFELEVFEPEVTALLTLAQITPPGTFPLATWAGRLSDQDDRCCLAAQLAIHGWLVEMMEGASGGQRRQVRQVLRRAEQGVTDAGTVAPFVNLPPDVLPDFRRLYEIKSALAAGQMPPPPDAAAENRSAPRAVLARLPETQPRTDCPDQAQSDGSSTNNRKHGWVHPGKDTESVLTA